MTAAEIRSLLEEQKSTLREAFAKSDESTVPATMAAALISLSLFAGEIALQLAELNEKLDPARLVAAIEEIQTEMDKREKTT